MSLRRFLPLLVLLAVSITLMTYQSNKGNIEAFGFLGNPLNRLNSMLQTALTSVNAPFGRIMLRDEDNRRLREDINRLLLERQGYRDVLLENQRLRDILLLKGSERRYIATARIISRSMDQWSNVLIIDKGKSSGISKNMSVITPKGLVGKISLASEDYAHVLLVTDINFAAAVKLQEARRDDILSGTGFGGCILKYVPYEETVKEGDIVVTSGFDELFPPGIPIGRVSTVSRKSAGIFQLVEVKPFQDPAKLDEVVILKR